MSKITLTKIQALKILRFYGDYLAEKYIGKPATPAIIEYAKQDLLYKQNEMANINKNLIWKIPIVIINDSYKININVDESKIDWHDEEQICFLDID